MPLQYTRKKASYHSERRQKCKNKDTLDISPWGIHHTMKTPKAEFSGAKYEAVKDWGKGIWDHCWSSRKSYPNFRFTQNLSFRGRLLPFFLHLRVELMGDTVHYCKFSKRVRAPCPTFTLHIRGIQTNSAWAGILSQPLADARSLNMCWCLS